MNSTYMCMIITLFLLTNFLTFVCCIKVMSELKKSRPVFTDYSEPIRLHQIDRFLFPPMDKD